MLCCHVEWETVLFNKASHQMRFAFRVMHMQLDVRIKASVVVY